MSSTSSSSSISSSSSSSGPIPLCTGDVYIFDGSVRSEEFAYCEVEGSTATMVVFDTNVVIGVLGGEFVWDIGGPDEHSFSVVDEYILVYTYQDGVVVRVTYNGKGSFLFTVRYDYVSNRTLPFELETDVIRSIWDMVDYNGVVYAGTGSEGILLKSGDRNFWEKVFAADDVHITALEVQADRLYIGTAPKGKIYMMALPSEDVNLSQELSGETVGFLYYQAKMYVATKNPSVLYFYNAVDEEWQEIYKPYGNITEIFEYQNKLFLILDAEVFVCFDGIFWYIIDPVPDDISSTRNVATEPYSGERRTSIQRTSAIELSNLNDEDKLAAFPENWAKGALSACIDGSTFIIGASNQGRIYGYGVNMSDIISANVIISSVQVIDSEDNSGQKNLSISILPSGTYTSWNLKLDAPIEPIDQTPEVVNVNTGTRYVISDVSTGEHIVYVALVDESGQVVSNQVSQRVTV